MTAVNDKLRRGEASLEFEPVSGYLRSVVKTFGIAVESQVLVYSQTSFQARRINAENPRAVYFNDSVAVGFVRGGDILEIAVQDPQQGTIFYTLAQTATSAPAFERNDKCLSCHLSWDTRAVPGPFVLTVFPRRSDAEYANGFQVDNRSPLDERWGGWYVTGARVPASIGNQDLLQPKMPSTGPRPVAAKRSLEGIVDLKGYPAPFSDVVALMVLEHQTLATNLITRAGWEFRVGGETPRVREAVEELADYLTFKDEPPLPHPVTGTSGFAEAFGSMGPKDGKGRSLREFDLKTRLMRYPLSYMVHSAGFRGLPPMVRSAVLTRALQNLKPAERTMVTEMLDEFAPELKTKN
ncbi:MAG: hypothetical protein M3478_11995 [Planctomycetota bacterium]|nr:hypothetical protein [Planctomycetota bacterium]